MLRRHWLRWACLSGASAVIMASRCGPAIPRLGQEYQLNLVVSPAQVARGNSIRLIGTITNLRDREVVLNFGSTCQASFTVTDSTGRRMGIFDDQICLAVLTDITIPAFGVHTDSLTVGAQRWAAGSYVAYFGFGFGTLSRARGFSCGSRTA